MWVVAVPNKTNRKWSWILPKPPISKESYKDNRKLAGDLTQATNEERVMKNGCIHNNALAFTWGE
jgi:hypothetical protein